MHKFGYGKIVLVVCSESEQVKCFCTFFGELGNQQVSSSGSCPSADPSPGHQSCRLGGEPQGIWLTCELDDTLFISEACFVENPRQTLLLFVFFLMILLPLYQ